MAGSRPTGDPWRRSVAVCEIRVGDESGTFRLIYIAKFPEALYVLHAFQKKTQTTAAKDLTLAKARYQESLAKRKAL